MDKTKLNLWFLLHKKWKPYKRAQISKEATLRKSERHVFILLWKMGHRRTETSHGYRPNADMSGCELVSQCKTEPRRNARVASWRKMRVWLVWRHDAIVLNRFLGTGQASDASLASRCGTWHRDAAVESWCELALALRHEVESRHTILPLLHFLLSSLQFLPYFLPFIIFTYKTQFEWLSHILHEK